MSRVEFIRIACKFMRSKRVHDGIFLFISLKIKLSSASLTVLFGWIDDKCTGQKVEYAVIYSHENAPEQHDSAKCFTQTRGKKTGKIVERERNKSQAALFHDRRFS